MDVSYSDIFLLVNQVQSLIVDTFSLLEGVRVITVCAVSYVWTKAYFTMFITRYKVTINFYPSTHCH